MLNVSPLHRDFETLPGLNNPSIPALASLPTGETEDTTRLVERFGDDILAAGQQNGLQVVHVKPERLVELATFLRDDQKLAYEMLPDVSSVDASQLPISDVDKRFSTVYQFRSLLRRKHLMVVCPLADDDTPTAPSLSSVFAAANWPEREVIDLMGINFEGHPDPRRILMPPKWPNHPLRKDVPLGGEEVPFSLTWDDPQFDSLGTQILPALSEPPALPPGMDRQNMIINMGPQHPSTHGVLRLVVELDGDGNVVWKVSNEDLPGNPIDDTCGGQRLPNGNTVITAYHAKVGTKLLEVTRDKQVVWKYDGPNRVHHFQILSTNGESLRGKPLK